MYIEEHVKQYRTPHYVLIKIMRTGRKKNLMIKTQGFKNQIHLVKKIKGNVNLMQIHVRGNLHISHKWQFLFFSKY